MNMRERIVRDDMREKILGVGAVTGEGGPTDNSISPSCSSLTLLSLILSLIIISLRFVSSSSLRHVRLILLSLMPVSNNFQLMSSGDWELGVGDVKGGGEGGRDDE